MVYSTDVKKYHIGIGAEDVGKYVLLPGDPKRVPKMAEFLKDAKQVGDTREYMSYTGELDGERVTVISSGMGGPSTAIAIEELYELGVHTIIRVGTCGGMQPEVDRGHVIVGSGAIRFEGTTKEYCPIEFPAIADLECTNALVKSSAELGFVTHVGVTQSKDSFYGQHKSEEMPIADDLDAKWKAWCRMGCLASEMEGAALAVVGQFRGIRTGMVFQAIGAKERERAGLPVHDGEFDTSAHIKVGVLAIRKLIAHDTKHSKSFARPRRPSYTLDSP